MSLVPYTRQLLLGHRSILRLPLEISELPLGLRLVVYRRLWVGMGWNGMEWDGMVWDGMGWGSPLEVEVE
jgi:hypothetical protein